MDVIFKPAMRICSCGANLALDLDLDKNIDVGLPFKSRGSIFKKS